VREYLNTRFPGRCTGRAAPIAWPPCFPDLERLDFFLWGFVKDQYHLCPCKCRWARSSNYYSSCKSDVRDAA
jgi:hypothetical protein